MANTQLNNAQRNINDEFYTRRENIDVELQHYTQHLTGKVVYCNCDDPHKSEFTRYFIDHFHDLKLKKLISTCYQPEHAELFCMHESECVPNMLTVDTDNLPNGGELQMLKGDGHFRSTECVELLKEADIVVTNPPFSLFDMGLIYISANELPIQTRSKS